MGIVNEAIEKVKKSFHQQDWESIRVLFNIDRNYVQLSASQFLAASPYKTSWARFTPGLLNNEREINKALEAVHALK